MMETKIQIAVVDDDPSFLRALERLLSAASFQPLTYPSAESFLKESPRPHIDCLILDIRLGTMTGFDVARQVAAEFSRVPIIFMTAHDEPRTRALAAEVGCVAYLRKPFSAQALVEAIGQSKSPPSVPPAAAIIGQPHESDPILPRVRSGP